MADVYNRSGDNFGGAFAADAATISFAGEIGAGLLVQTLNCNYTQQVTRIWELGSDTTYYVVGRCSGQMGMNRVIGPRVLQIAFYQNYGDACNAANNQIHVDARAGCSSNQTSDQYGSMSLDMKNCVITTLGFAVSANDMVLNETIGMMFASLEVEAGVNTAVQSELA